jgi:hypothetical protein
MCTLPASTETRVSRECFPVVNFDGRVEFRATKAAVVVLLRIVGYILVDAVAHSGANCVHGVRVFGSAQVMFAPPLWVQV